RQWAALSEEMDPTEDVIEPSTADYGGEESRAMYRQDSVGNVIRLLDVLRNAVGSNQVTRGSKEILGMVQQLSRFQEATSSSTADELRGRVVSERGVRTLSMPG